LSETVLILRRVQPLAPKGKANTDKTLTYDYALTLTQTHNPTV